MHRYQLYIAVVVCYCLALPAQPAEKSSAIATAVAGQAGGAIPACQATHVVAAGDKLTGISDFYFGTSIYGRAILQATNARSGDSAFGYIDNPGALPIGSPLCIPGLQEAERRRLHYKSYEQSIIETMAPRPEDVSHSLVKIDPRHPVRVVTWIRASELDRYRLNGKWVTTAPKDIWITVAPEIKTFCQAFVKDHGANAEQLTLRLEQRLGMPPAAGKTDFFELVVDDPSGTTNLFRPCKDPSTRIAACNVGPPSGTNGPYQYWFLNQYYGAFAQTQPDQYPWTALGYTFDWATQDDGHGDRRFVRYGASEFVIPKGAAIDIQGSIATASYCKPQ